MVYYDAEGNAFPRPEGQDKKPKQFKSDAVTLIRVEELSERYILFMLANYPYLYNTFFDSDINNMTKGEDSADQNSNYNKGRKILQMLISKGLVKPTSNVVISYEITWKGRWFRLVSHPFFPLVAPSLAVLSLVLTLLVVPLFKQCNTSPGVTWGNLRKSDSAQHLPSRAPKNSSRRRKGQ